MPHELTSDEGRAMRSFVPYRTVSLAPIRQKG